MTEEDLMIKYDLIKDCFITVRYGEFDSEIQVSDLFRIFQLKMQEEVSGE